MWRGGKVCQVLPLRTSCPAAVSHQSINSPRSYPYLLPPPKNMSSDTHEGEGSLGVASTPLPLEAEVLEALPAPVLFLLQECYDLGYEQSATG